MKRRIFTIALILTISILSFIGGTKINKENSLNMNTVVDYETTESGLMLYTNDGNGYYIEK